MIIWNHTASSGPVVYHITDTTTVQVDTEVAVACDLFINMSVTVTISEDSDVLYLLEVWRI